jgi:hypothetical protein
MRSTNPVDMVRLRDTLDVEYRESLPLPSANRPFVTERYLTRTTEYPNKPNWHDSEALPTALPFYDLESCGYLAIGHKDGRMVLATFGFALLGDALSEAWSTSPMLMLTPWSGEGGEFQGPMTKRYDVISDWSSVEFVDEYDGDTLMETWDFVAHNLDTIYRDFFTNDSDNRGWVDAAFAGYRGW